MKSSLPRFMIIKPLVLAGYALFGLVAHANPAGGVVAAGEVTITGSGRTLTITQGTDRAIITWQDFSNEAGELTRFVQPDSASATLNRVVSGQPSALFGQLEANGRVFLINPNGILVGAGARIDTAGFLASTLDVADDAFLAVDDLRFSGASVAAVQNLGAINALGGDVFLIARTVENAGTITATGSAGLAAGSEVLLTTGGDARLFVQAASAPGGLVNAGTIEAATAELKAAGGNAYALAINNTGQVRATGTAERGGKLWLVADGGDIANTGMLDASSPTGQGGDLTVNADTITLDPASRLTASGATGGGTILVLAADRTTVGGALEARATSAGDGGFIETSAAHVTIGDDARLSTAAASGRAGAWLIDPVDFTIAASGGDLTGATLGTNLGSTDVTIQSISGGSGTAGNVNVNDTVSWSANTLTLNAQNNINLNASLTGSGTAKLALEYGQGAVAASNTSDYLLKNGIQVTLPAGNNFSTKLGSDGTVKNYTVITSLGAAGSTTGTDLQGMGGSLSAHYALGADIDAAATSGWNSNAGFLPVGDAGTQFTGTFTGLGHTIRDLTINRSTNYVGLFGNTGSSTIRNVGLVGGSVTGASSVGGLVGSNGSTISGSYATGSVSGTSVVGGLVGNNSSTISGSYATGSVSLTTSSGRVGGLVGNNTSTISGSYATGSVSSTSGNYVGGLVGLNGGTISGSYTTGSVSTTSGSNIGGLVGINSLGTITNSYWDKETTGQTTSSGGGTGLTTAQMKAQANFSGFDFTNTWILYEGQTTPLLRSFLTPITLTPVYDGSTQTLTKISAYTANVASPVTANLIDTAAGLTLSSTTTAGTASAVLHGFSSTQQGYLISYATRTITGTGSAADDLNITNPLTWSAGRLTLNAQKNINFNASLTGSGTAKLALEYGQGAVAASNTSDYLLKNRIQVTLPAGSNFSTKLGSDGTVKNYTVITSLGAAGSTTGTDLQGMGGSLGTHYALAADIDAAATSGWNSNAGFLPVGNFSTKFTGTFAGLGHTISNLTSNRAGTDDVGLFGYTDTGATIRNVGLVGGSVAGKNEVGFLVGRNRGTISSSYATGSVSSTNGESIGGLVGYNNNGTISGSYATGSVEGGLTVGGLVGFNGGTIRGSYATGSVSGKASDVGGLAGSNNNATINSSYATGSVSTTGGSPGGLVGYNVSGTITNSYWDKETTGQTTSSGDGTGLTTAQMKQQANFSGFDFTNTWVIYAGQTTPLLRSFLTPLTVTAKDATKTNDGAGYSGGNGVTYSTTPNSNLLGTVSYSGTAQGAINAGSYTLTPGGLYSNQQGYLISYASGTLTISGSAPASATALTITANDASRTYGSANPAFTAGYAGFVNGDTASVVSGLQFSTTATMGSNVGTYTITPYGATAPSTYTLAYVSGLLTINPAALTVTANDASRTYGSANPGLTASYSGWVNGDTADVMTGLQFSTPATASSNVGTYAITPSGATAANYTLAYVSGQLTVSPAVLTITALDATREYHQANPAFTAGFDGFVNGDPVSVVSGLAFDTPATPASLLGEYTITPSGATAANYTIDYVNGTLRVQTPTVMVGSSPQPVFTLGPQPVISTDFAVVMENGHPVLMPLSTPAGSTPPVEAQLTFTLNGTNAGSGGPGVPVPVSQSSPGGAETVAPLVAGTTGPDETGLLRETTLPQGRFNIVYQEPLTEAEQQEAANTATGSSYRDFSPADEAATTFVRFQPNAAL